MDRHTSPVTLGGKRMTFGGATIALIKTGFCVFNKDISRERGGSGTVKTPLLCVDQDEAAAGSTLSLVS